MPKTLLLVLPCVALVACATKPIVYAPGDLAGAEATGHVEALATMLPSEGGDLRLVFVHGVGDHCAGYALDPKTGWLKDETAAALGLQPLGPPSPPHKIPAEQFRGGGPDGRSYMEYETRAFELRLPGAGTTSRIEAIEVTWSHLTQWLKTYQLGYDLTASAADDGIPSCVASPGPEVPQVKAPPGRLLVNRVLKEQVLDRTLADAVIYTGPYGATIERGLAETLCRATAGPPDDSPRCAWPAPDGPRRRTFFVTHSLGSRLLYDTLLDLTGFHEGPKPAPFSQREIDAARPFVRRMLATTPAIYMMANQWSLLGLADTPPDARSENGPQPLLVQPALAPEAADVPAFAPRPTAPGRHCRIALAALGELRMQALPEALSGAPPRLRVVAFNDTNDLLTWHVPLWYTDARAAGDAACRPDIDLADVFVQNAAHWLIFESPSAAHDDYFIQPEVWQVVRCGAQNGRANECP